MMNEEAMESIWKNLSIQFPYYLDKWEEVKVAWVCILLMCKKKQKNKAFGQNWQSTNTPDIPKTA